VRARFVVVGAVVVMVTAGCGGGGPGAEFSNYTSERLTVSIEGTDEVLDVEPSSDVTLDRSGCAGTGVVVTKQDGTVVAAFDGKTCGRTAVAVRGDWSVLVSGELRERAPSPTP